MITTVEKVPLKATVKPVFAKEYYEDKLTELEKAQRKIAQLEREKEEFRRKYELLKKAEMNERW